MNAINETIDYLHGKIAEEETKCVRDCDRMRRNDGSTQDAIGRRWRDFRRSTERMRQEIGRITTAALQAGDVLREGN